MHCLSAGAGAWTRRLIALAMLAATACPAVAGEPAPVFGRYLPKYPAIYYSVGYLQDDRDASFDQQGHAQSSAVPTVPGRTSFPEKRMEVSFTSFFPLLEDAGIPYLSTRVHSARLTLRYGKAATEGAVADYIATNPEFMPQSQPGDSGLGDVSLEWGTFLAGAKEWRTRKDTPFAAVLLFGFDVPVGSYEQTSPVPVGSNRFAYGPTLGLHWRPWSGGFVEGGGGVRAYAENHNPHFGALAPAQQGRDTLLNLSLTQRLFRGAYLGAFATDRRGAANEYRHIRYAPNQPAPDPAPPGGTTESFPVDGAYRDGGTALRVAGLSFNYFVTQRLMAALDYSHPLSGRSGQMLVPFRQRQCPAGSLPGAITCSESDAGTVLVDGQGTARSFDSDSIRLSVSYNFGHSDLFSCTGCEQ
jgi:hypothetical protein